MEKLENTVSMSDAAAQPTVQGHLAKVPETPIDINYAYPLSTYFGYVLVFLILKHTYSAIRQKSLQKSVLVIGWSVVIFLLAIASTAWTMLIVCDEVATNPLSTFGDFAGGIYCAFLFHGWMLFAAAAGVAIGTCLLAKYWPHDKRAVKLVQGKAKIHLIEKE